MTKLITDFLAYLKAVFGETWRMVCTLFDILGIALLFYPKLAENLVSNELLIRTIGGLIFFISFLLANFSLYREMADATSYQADIRLEVLEKGFSHSYGSGRSPFREIPKNPYGFDRQGLPDWCYLWANIGVVNIGYEKGQLAWELDKAKTKLPSLFAPDKVNVEFYPPGSLEGRNSSGADFFFDVLLTEREPYAFAQSLKALVKSKQGYQVVLRYKTKRVDGESSTRELPIIGDFQDFCQEILTYWDKNGFADLVDLARIT
jgi:hypothetical protein